jgi:hypothetical protein
MSDLPEPPPPARVPRGGLRAGRFVVGLVIIVGGVAALLQAANVTTVPWKIVLPGALIAVGLGLIVAGGRSERGQGGLIAVGIVLTVILTAAAAADISFEGGVGERTERPTTLGSLKGEYSLALGQLTLDLTDLHAVLLTGSPRAIRARVGIGQLTVILPTALLVTVRARSTVGQVTIFGRSDGGFGVEKELVPRIPAGQTIGMALDLSVGVGEVFVEHG